MAEFHNTIMGNKFFTYHIPELIKAINNTADAVRENTKMLEKLLDEKKENKTEE